MARQRIPATKPKWTGGKYIVMVGDEMQGYFRTFTGAWHWRGYLAATLPNGTVLRILEHGRTVNIHRVGDAAALNEHGSLI